MFDHVNLGEGWSIELYCECIIEDAVDNMNHVENMDDAVDNMTVRYVAGADPLAPLEANKDG